MNYFDLKLHTFVKKVHTSKYGTKHNAYAG